MADLPNYDNWLEKPYAELFDGIDCPPYIRYLEEWHEQQMPDYEAYVDDCVADGETPLSYGAYLKDTRQEPQDLDDFIRELNEAAYEEELRLRGYDF